MVLGETDLWQRHSLFYIDRFMQGWVRSLKLHKNRSWAIRLYRNFDWRQSAKVKESKCAAVNDGISSCRIPCEWGLARGKFHSRIISRDYAHLSARSRSTHGYHRTPVHSCLACAAQAILFLCFCLGSCSTVVPGIDLLQQKCRNDKANWYFKRTISLHGRIRCARFIPPAGPNGKRCPCLCIP